MMDADVMIVSGQRLQHPDETINIDLPAFFTHQLNARHKKWIMVKGPTRKYYVEHFYERIEKALETDDEQEYIISWYDYLEQACDDPGEQIRFYWLANNEQIDASAKEDILWY